MDTWTLGHSGHSGHSKIFCEKNLTFYFENGHLDTGDTQDTQEKKNLTLYFENGHWDTQDTWDTPKYSVKKI